MTAQHARGGAATIDLTDDAGRDTHRAPVGRNGQLEALRRQLEWCDQALVVAQRETARAMRDQSLEEAERWAAVRRLRNLAWKVCREILPLVGRVPSSLQAHESFREVERVCHVLRRRTEEALRDNANWTVDLVVAQEAPLVGRVLDPS